MNFIWRRSNLPSNIFRVLSNQMRLQALATCCYQTKNINERISTTNLKPLNISYNTTRHKSKKVFKCFCIWLYLFHNKWSKSCLLWLQQNDADSDDEAETYDDGDLSLSRDSKVVKFNTTSLRTDAILKSALGIARKWVIYRYYFNIQWYICHCHCIIHMYSQFLFRKSYF